MPKSAERCSTNMSSSSNEPLSSSSSMRSRAVSFPLLCWASMRAVPPPRRAFSRRFSRLSRMSFIEPLPCNIRLQEAYHGTRQVGRIGDRLGIPGEACLEPRMSEPATTAQLLQQGLFHHRQGDIALAMERYVEVLQRDPQNADALYYVAMVACQDGQFQQGAELARRAIVVGPPQARLHNLLGQALYRLGHPLEAPGPPPRPFGAAPPQARLHTLLGQALYRLGQPLEAVKNFDQAIALDANFADAHGNRANILIDAGFPDEALKSLDRGLALNPTSATDWLNRGALLQS